MILFDWLLVGCAITVIVLVANAFARDAYRGR